MPPTSGELWGSHLRSEFWDLELLLPTGFVIYQKIARETTVKEVKDAIWKEARLLPFFNKLDDIDTYVLVGLTNNGEEEEFYDETRRVYDLRIVEETLRVVQPKGNKTENILNAEVGQSIGIPVADLNKMATSKEVLTFRRNLLHISNTFVDQLKTFSSSKLVSYMYEAVHDSSDMAISCTVRSALQSIDSIYISVKVDNSTCNMVKINKMDTVLGVLIEILRKTVSKQPNRPISDTTSDEIMTKYAENYALKIISMKAYITRLDIKLILYQYFQSCITSKKVPMVKIVKIEDIVREIPAFTFVQPAYALYNSTSDDDCGTPGSSSLLDKVSLWGLSHHFAFTIKCGQYVNTKENCKLYVRVGIYHGFESIETYQQTTEKPNGNPTWNEKIEFNIKLFNLPRAARLCLALVQKTEKKNKQMEFSVGWANVNIFNYLGYLIKGTLRLPLTYSHTDENTYFLNPGGHVYHQYSCATSTVPDNTTCLLLEFSDYAHNKHVAFPLDADVCQYGQDCERGDPPNQLPTSRQTLDKINDIVQRDPLCDLSEQEKSFLWMARNVCQNIPSSLPRLAQSVKWDVREDVARFYYLLGSWPMLETEVALELLGINYIDHKLREFAVAQLWKCLSASEMCHYLLQLTQSIKSEPYLNNRLSEFMLLRALENVDIALPFFWYMKAEMSQPEHRMRFGLILEALCRGCGPFLKVLSTQSDALDTLALLSEYLKKQREEDQLKAFHERLSNTEFRDSVQNFTSPLDKSNQLGSLVVEQCHIKKSKKRPLWLVWNNNDEMPIMPSHYRLIFKHGDDLRQDMLTLQMIRIMDKIWKMEGRDLKLVPYACLSTGYEQGLIEAVSDAQTVMSIQNKQFKAAIQIDPSQLHRWLQERNPGAQYDEAVENFTKSCAGYCVATFILGIRDRHPDNIMLNSSGQLFHIDFGHFLNNRKKKFGINRERVPFVLTEDFVCVIARGVDRPYKSEQFNAFMVQCGKAYLELRKHSKLFLTLFTMMLPCGIPELSSLNDLEYLRKTLAVEMNDTDALKYFNSKFSEAYNGAWTTKMDWFFHKVKN